ncbi:hypothetical protein J2T12_004185 [Paenibacillus anaericanus]|nr:hypothetical protein [Paenibacillus anaericanus]
MDTILYSNCLVLKALNEFISDDVLSKDSNYPLHPNVYKLIGLYTTLIRS